MSEQPRFSEANEDEDRASDEEPQQQKAACERNKKNSCPPQKRVAPLPPLTADLFLNYFSNFPY